MMPDRVRTRRCPAAKKLATSIFAGTTALMRIVGARLAAEIDLGVALRTAGRRRWPVLGTKLFCDAQARTSVPSTEKCSVLNSPFARACANTSSNNTAHASCAIRRSRFLEKVE